MRFRVLLLGGLCLGGGLLGSPARADDAKPTSSSISDRWTATIATDFRYFSWKSNRGFPTGMGNQSGSGSELYTPFAAQIVGLPTDVLKIELLGRGGWVHAQQSSAGVTGGVSTATDTQVSATATYLGINGLQPFASINFNVPTGKSALFGPAANARMDPDLVEIATFGEGLNVGPTVGANLTIDQSWMMSASVGYTKRGSFVRESGLAPADATVQVATNIQPGNVLTGTGAVAYQSGPFSAKIEGSISHETETKVDGNPFVQPGLRYLLSGTWIYDFKEAGATTLTASWAYSRRNKVVFCNTQPGSLIVMCAPSLAPETFNSNANLYKVGLQHLIPVGALSVGPIGSWLLRTNNSYDPQTLQFVPAKTRWSAGIVGQYNATNKLVFNARLERVWTHENDRPGETLTVLGSGPLVTPIPAIPVVSSQGWQMAAGLNWQF